MSIADTVPAFKYVNITSTANTVVKGAQGVLRGMFVGSVGTTWAITLADSSTPGATTPPIITFTPPAVGFYSFFDLAFNNGLSFTSTGTAGNLTLVYC
jgi:hypothetical protein